MSIILIIIIRQHRIMPAGNSLSDLSSGDKIEPLETAKLTERDGGGGGGR